MWRKAISELGKFRRRGDTTWRTSGVIPIGIIVLLAVVCVVVAVLGSAGRADDVELQQERLLLTNAIAMKGSTVPTMLAPGRFGTQAKRAIAAPALSATT